MHLAVDSVAVDSVDVGVWDLGGLKQHMIQTTFGKEKRKEGRTFLLAFPCGLSPHLGPFSLVPVRSFFSLSHCSGHPSTHSQ